MTEFISVNYFILFTVVLPVLANSILLTFLYATENTVPAISTFIYILCHFLHLFALFHLFYAL